MTIKCYYPINPYTQQHVWCANNIFELVYKELVRLYPDFSFKLIDSIEHSKKIGIHHHGFPGCKFGYHRMIIKNEETKKYFIINYYDTLNSIHSINGWDVENIAEIFSSTGAHADNVHYNENNINYTPSSYCLRSKSSEEYLQDNPTAVKSKLSLLFRGTTYFFREYIQNDSRFDVRTDFINELDYIKELQENFISLSLNGTGEICHRDIESFASKCAVIRPQLTVKFHNPLIEDYHYIAIKTDDLLELETSEFYKALSSRIYSKYLEVKDDSKYLNFIAKNGFDWYKNNGSILNNVNILTKLINFNKLL